MAKLTDTHLIVLSKAAQRDDGAAVMPEKMSKAAAAKVGTSLVTRKLMREIRSKRDMPVWRKDGDGRPFSLIITRGGRDAISVDEDEGAALPSNNEGEKPRLDKKSDRITPMDSDRDASGARFAHPNAATPRPGSKQALVIEMLSKEKGATLDALIKATGWLPHTTRAALTGLRKKGYRIERQSGDGARPSTWRIIVDAKLAA